MTLKDYKTKFSCKPKQRPVITRKLNEIIQETNQAFMTKISENFEGTFLSDRPFLKNTKSSS